MALTKGKYRKGKSELLSFSFPTFSFRVAETTIKAKDAVSACRKVRRVIRTAFGLPV